jgi:hypothetical protein
VITTICSAIQYRFPEKSGEMSSSSLSSVRVFDRFLAAKPEFSYEAVCTVNLLALRLQWFESTPTQASYRGILQELPFEAVNARKRPVFQQVHKKTLCQVLGVVRRMPAEPSEDVERIPIKPAQLG